MSDELALSPSLPRAGSRWRGPLSQTQEAQLGLMREPDELTLATEEVSLCDPYAQEYDGGIIWVSATRACLLGWRKGQEALSVIVELGPKAKLELEPSTLGRDRFLLQERALFYGPRTGKAQLRRLVELTNLESPERMLSAAQDELDDKRWWAASELLAGLEPLLDHQEPAQPLEPEQAPATQPMTYVQRYDLMRAQIALWLGLAHDAIAALARLTKRRPEDSLIHTSATFKELATQWLLLLALAHEEAEDYKSAAAAYAALLEADPSQEALRLQQARCAKLDQDTTQSVEAYQAFIHTRTKGQAFDLIGSFAHKLDDLAQTGGDDLELINACLELGELQEALEQPLEAAKTYLTLIRHAPFASQGYARYFALDVQRLEAPHRARLPQQAASILKLLNPKLALELKAQGALPGDQASAASWFVQAEPLSEQDHEGLLRHPGEKDKTHVAQRWLGELLSETPSTADIELHCQRLSATQHPELVWALTQLATILSIGVPRCYLSHGLPGARVMGHELDPFILVGASHFEPESAQALNLRQQVFVIGAQMAHIRAKHTILTSSEFWGAFRAKTLEGATIAMSMIPIGGMLGKVTDKMLGPLLKRLTSSSDQALLKTLASYLAKKVEAGESAGAIQGAYEATLGRMLTSTKRDQAPETLLKEQLADFARSAMYTADRVGLLACDDLEEATRALLLLAHRASAEIITLETEGVLGLLKRRDARGELLYSELILRLSELFKFALSEDYLILRARYHDATPALTDDLGSGS